MTDLLYSYIQLSDEAFTEGRIERVVGYLIRDYDTFHVMKDENKYKAYIRCGENRIKHECDYGKLSRSIQGEAIVSFRQKMKRYKDNKQCTLFNIK